MTQKTFRFTKRMLMALAAALAIVFVTFLEAIK